MAGIIAARAEVAGPMPHGSYPILRPHHRQFSLSQPVGNASIQLTHSPIRFSQHTCQRSMPRRMGHRIAGGVTYVSSCRLERRPQNGAICHPRKALRRYGASQGSFSRAANFGAKPRARTGNSRGQDERRPGSLVSRPQRPKSHPSALRRMFGNPDLSYA